ncbi:MAG: 1-phosphofructokinase family hexose kinase [Anaerolineae bacterium]|nr:1-phosphofructokinase family hexose kinase [Anaerolineae bacterium]
MILCVTPNPAVDRTLVVHRFEKGSIFRTEETVVIAGGKGINVARTVQLLGGNATCAGFLAGYAGRFIADSAQNDGLAGAWTILEKRESRTCIILVDSETDQSTVINEVGPVLNKADWKQFEADILKASESAAIICFCGSLPPNSDLEIFTDILRQLLATGKRVWVDSSGDALKAATTVEGIAIKVNDEEASELLNQHIVDVDSAAKAAKALHERSSAPIVLTLGADGAIFANNDSLLHAVSPTVDVKNTVGSGDAFFAGLLVALEKGVSASDALRQATAAGTANALNVGMATFTMDEWQELAHNTLVRTLN